MLSDGVPDHAEAPSLVGAPLSWLGASLAADIEPDWGKRPSGTERASWVLLAC